MRELLIATSNAYKLEEIMYALRGVPFALLSVKDVGLEALSVDEPADTLEENAIIKAVAYAERLGKLTLADDTGIFVDALGGRPGVKSARYAPTAEERNKKLLEEMKDVPEDKRDAEFRCSIAIFDPDTQKTHVCDDLLKGTVLRESRKGRNFNYDLIFMIPEVGKSYSELTIEEKDAISHRGKALRKAREILMHEFI
jgi:XTP/dITP diphosphohydrolase